MNPILSTALLMLIVVVGFALVISIGNPLINEAQTNIKLKEMEAVFLFLDNSIKEVLSEGAGAKRVLSVRLTSPIEIYGDTIRTRIKTNSELMQYFSRKEGVPEKISGSDVSCHENGNLTMRNSYINVTIRKLSGFVNTSTLLLSVSKNGKKIEFEDSTVSVDNITNGTGYSELMETGNNLPLCRAHVFVNNTISFDIFYTLYAYADFLVIDVENIKS